MSQITVTPLAPALGAKIGGVDLRRVDESVLARIKDAWHKQENGTKQMHEARKL